MKEYCKKCNGELQIVGDFNKEYCVGDRCAIMPIDILKCDDCGEEVIINRYHEDIGYDKWDKLGEEARVQAEQEENLI